MLNEVMAILFIGIIYLLPIVLMIVDIRALILKKEKCVFEVFSFVMGAVYTVMAYSLWELPPYDEPLNYWSNGPAHAPINTEYLLTIGMVCAWSFLSYLILKFSMNSFAPIKEACLISGVYAGMILSVVWLIQLLCGANPQPIENSVLFGDGQTGVTSFHFERYDYIVLVCLCIVPVFYLVHCIHLLMRIVKEKAIEQESTFYENKVLNQINVILCKGANLFWGGAICLLPLFGILTIILILFGQRPDSVILAFTKTSDWILSGEISPPPVAYDTHYLCTVSLRGHKKVVKPIRYGIRRGEKIVVNRQLCVANAFEQLIQEKTPRFHRAVRNFYDTYGYPISKHINTPWAADVVYVIMKPLEWIFVFVLYLCDKKPEDRICSQYLPR